MNKLPQEQWHNSMRGYFAGALYNHMVNDPDIVVVTMDLGYGLFDKIRDDFPDRFYNVGAAEVAGMGIACGLALEGKVPFVYSITTFLLYRPFETIRTYINHEKLNVKLIGGGRDTDYKHDGWSHNSSDVKPHLDLLTNIEQHWPDTKEEIPTLLDKILAHEGPDFISLRR